jgi:hypothetical protein
VTAGRACGLDDQQAHGVVGRARLLLREEAHRVASGKIPFFGPS